MTDEDRAFIALEIAETRIRKLEEENKRLRKDIEMLERATGYAIENCKKEEEMDKVDKIFWLDGFKEGAQGGYFVRNPLFQFFQKIEKTGMRPVGIKVEDGWNMEILIAPETLKGEKKKEK